MKQIYHPWYDWECFKAGFYADAANFDRDSSLLKYADFLSDEARFRSALQRVITEWPVSCEHFLSNKSINRIAWLGQASMCIETGVPCWFRGGFRLLSDDLQEKANFIASEALKKWEALCEAA